MFYVGQKVVCVNAANNPGKQWGRYEALKEGHIYTIRSVHFDNTGDRVVWLDEIAHDPSAQRCWGPKAGYLATRFRPVVERKTDISIFTDMLKPKIVEVSA